MRMSQTESPYYTSGYDVSNAYIHKVRIRSLESEGREIINAVSKNPLVSDTKELSWFTTIKDKGLVTINTPYSQALIGFVKDNGKNVNNLSAKVNNRFCSITLSSLSDKTISNASKLLLIAGAKVENTGQKWNESHTKVTRTGRAPSLIEVVDGDLTLLNLNNAKKVSVSPLDGSGTPFGQPIEAVREGIGWKFAIGQTATPWYLIEVMR